MAQCINPVTLKKGSAIMHVPCTKCNYCLQNRRADWSFRLNEQARNSISAFFLTLTYDEQHQPYKQHPEHPEFRAATLDKRDIQLFLKRLRKANDEIEYDKYKWPRIKYYTVGEYGGQTFRPHYHSIIYNVKPDVLNRIQEIWNAGHVVVGTVEPASIHYVTKYVLNPAEGWEPIVPPFALISKGMGRDYLDTNGHEHKKALQTFVVNTGGAKQRLPRYYRDKIFSIRERETISESSIKQHDVLYQKAIYDLSLVHHEPENYHTFLQRYHHDRIQETIKGHKTKTTI